MLSVSTQFLKCLITFEDTIMQLTKQVVIKAESIADARSKVAKFVKRGATARTRSDDILKEWFGKGLTLHVTVYTDGEVAIHNHDCKPATWLNRVRDVEQYYVQD